MKRFLFLYIVLHSFFLCDAESVGVLKDKFPVYYKVLEGKTIRVREEPSITSETKKYLSAPCDIYVENLEEVEADGYTWLEISGHQGFVAKEFLMTEKNPLYKTEEQKLSQRVNVLRVIMLILAVIAFVLTLILWSPIKETAKSFMGVPDKNGMKKIFVFNKQPYKLMLLLCVAIAGSIIAALLVLLFVGILSWGVLGFTKLLLFGFVWIGIIVCVAGFVFCLLSQIIIGIPLIIVGGLIWHFDDIIEGWGRNCYDFGCVLLHDFNMMGYTMHLVANYWHILAATIFVPIAFFVVIAVIIMFFCFIMRGFESIVTAIYDISYKCPHSSCGKTIEPANYFLLEDGRTPAFKEEFYNLRPGPYGIFHIQNPKTGENLPTMLMNGRGKLNRLCANCKQLINAEDGGEKSIAIVGLPSSGKTTIVYNMIGQMLRKNKKYVWLTEKTDNKVKKYIEEVCDNHCLNSIEKTQVKDDTLSIQVMVKRKGFPFKLMFNDVAGELFTQTVNKKATGYFRNIDEIMFVIDPETIDFTLNKEEITESFNHWYHTKYGDFSSSGRKDLVGVLSVVENQIDKESDGQKDTIHFCFVLNKIDLGYIKDTSNEMNIKSFIEKDLGFANIVANVENSGYKSVHYYAVCATKNDVARSENTIHTLTKGVLKDLGIKGLK